MRVCQSLLRALPFSPAKQPAVRKDLLHGPDAADLRGLMRLQEGRQRGEHKQEQGDNGNGASSEGYDFTDGETQLMRICIDAMHTAGLAFIVQGISTMLLGEASANHQHSQWRLGCPWRQQLWHGAPAITHMQCFDLCALCAGIANFLTGYNAGGVSMTYNGFSKAVTAALLFKASASFDRAVTAPGCNMASLLSAIGPEGLTKLWHQLTVFAWTVALSQASLPSVHPRLPAVCSWADFCSAWSSDSEPPLLHRPQNVVAPVCSLRGVPSMCFPQSLHLVSVGPSRYDPRAVSDPRESPFRHVLILSGRPTSEVAHHADCARSCMQEHDKVACICISYMSQCHCRWLRSSCPS